MPWSATIKPYPEALPLCYTVHVWPTLGALNKAWWNGRKPKRPRVWGFFDKQEPPLPVLGSINLCRGDPELHLTLIHECTHATHYAARVLGFAKPTWDNEELIALWHENTVKAALVAIGRRYRINARYASSR